MAFRHAFIRRAAQAGLFATLGSVFLFSAGCGPSKKELLRRAELERYEVQTRRMREAQAAREEAERAAAEAEHAARLAELARLEAGADADAASGDAGKALSSYRALLSELGNDPAADQRLREKLLRTGTAAAIPEAARRHAVRAQALVKAREGAGYAPAVSELTEALALAPWWADGYYNLGLMQEGAGDIPGAMHSLKLYLVGAPDGENAAEVQDKIYELEVLKEEHDKVSGLAGAWYVYFMDTGKTGNIRYDVAMDGAEFRARSTRGHILLGTVRGRDIEGKFTLPSLDAWDNNDCRTPEYTVPITGKIREDGRLITFNHMWNNYASTHWTISGLINTSGRRQGECISVSLQGTVPNEFNIAR